MNPLTNHFVTASADGAEWLLVWSWQAAVLLACVWAGLKAIRVKSPALRHQVWLFALIAVAAMQALSAAVQSLPLPQTNNRALTYAVELPRIVVTNDTVPVIQQRSPAVSVKPSIKRPIILSLLFALWIAGVCVFIVKGVINGFRLRRLRAGALLASLADLDCYECDCEALRSGKARLALSDDIRSPILLGVFRPMIVFPADITSWTSPVERGAMLRHEMAHVERRDHYVNLFQTVLGAVFFFHPLARYACRQLAVEREIACDDHVVGSGAEAESYAESIIKAAERGIGAPHGAHRLALFSARQLLERRIEMILNRGRMRVFAHQWRYMFLFGAMIAAVSVLLISSRQSKIAAQSTINNDDGQEMIAMVRQMADRIAGDPGEDMSRKLDDFFGQIQSNETGEEIFQKLDDFAQQKFIVTRVEVDDFQVNPDGPGSYVKYTDGAKATVNFLSTIYLKNPFSREEKSIADRCAIEMVKAQGEWMAVPPPPPPPPPPQRHSKDVPPPPPPPPPDPWTLVVKLLQEGGGYRLNGIDFQSLEELRQRLNNALNGRPADKKTVLVQVYATIADDEVAKVFNTIRSAGGAPRLTWDPLSLVVTISQSGGSYKLNAINFSSLKDLSQRLYKALNGRPADKKTVYVRAAETIADEEVVKVFDAITAAGGRPIRIKK